MTDQIQLNSNLNLDSVVRDFSEINQLRGIFELIVDWLIIICTILLYQYIDYILLYPLVVIVIGARQHALGVICHDIVHYRFLKNRKLADFLGNFFMTWPMFFTINGYRSMHLRHHKYVNTDDDPDLVRRKGKWDWIFPKGKTDLYKMFIMDIFALNTFQYIKKIFFYKNDDKLKEDYKRVHMRTYLLQFTYYAFLFIILFYTNNIQNYILFWIIPMLTWLKFAKRVRAMAEHFGIPNAHYAELTRTVYTNSFGKFFICPHGINYHISHHKYPSIPMYNLEKFHHKLKELGVFNGLGHISHGYFSEVINDMTKECQLNKSINKTI
jgi:fatty acid desaturase